MTKSPKIGIPPFKGTLKQARASGYTFKRATNDILDNIINKCKNIKVETEFDPDTGRLYTINFYDDYQFGFENLRNEGESNPFNMAHTRLGHSQDEETSEFGMGLKLAAMFLGNSFQVYTRILDENGQSLFYKIGFDVCKRRWIKSDRAKASNVRDNPRLWTSQGGDKVPKHQFQVYVQTLGKIDETEPTMLISENIIDCSDIIKTDVSILVNDEKVEPKIDYLSHLNCQPSKLRNIFS